MECTPERLGKIIKSASITAFEAEYWNPRKSNFEPAMAMKRLKNATKRLLRTSFEDCDPTVLNDSFQCAMYGHADKVCRMFEKVVTTHVRANLLPKLKSVERANLVRVLRTTLNDFRGSMEQFGAVLRHVDERLRNGKKFLKVGDLGLKCFVEEILLDGEISRKLTDVVLERVDEQRRGSSVGVEELKSFVELLDSMEFEVDGRGLRAAIFEESYLRRAEEFYKVLAEDKISKLTCYDYVDEYKKVQEEERRAIGFFAGKETMRKSKEMLRRVFICDKVGRIVYNDKRSLVELLQQDEVAKAMKVCKCINKIKRGRNVLNECVIAYFISAGKALVKSMNKKEVASQLGNLIKLKENITKITKSSFKKEIILEFSKIVCDKHVIESLSVFIDQTLKQNVKVDQEKQLSENINQFMTIFKFVENKEFFKLVYHRSLGKRLLSEKCSLGSEKMVVEKIKEECGSDYTSKFEKMFKDLETCREFNDRYNNNRASKMATNIKILSPFIWSVKNSHPINMPPSILETFESYSKFYRSSFGSNRVLKLNYLHGSAEVVFVTAGKPDKVLQVGNFQMTVLMLFNARDQWTVKDISRETKIPMEALRNVLRSLASGKTNVLLSSSQNEVSSEDILEVNDDFTSKRRKVKIPMAALPDEERKEKRQIRKSYAVFSKEAIRAAIVRVMKQKKSLSYNLLVVEALKVLAGKIKPDVKEIKEEVEYLVRYDFIKREAENSDNYLYIS